MSRCKENQDELKTIERHLTINNTLLLKFDLNLTKT